MPDDLDPKNEFENIDDLEIKKRPSTIIGGKDFGENSFLKSKYNSENKTAGTSPVLPIKEISNFKKQEQPDFNENEDGEAEKFGSQYTSQESKINTEILPLTKEPVELNTSVLNATPIQNPEIGQNPPKLTEKSVTTDLKNVLDKDKKPTAWRKFLGFFAKHKKGLTLTALLFLILGLIGSTVAAFWLIDRYSKLDDVVAQAVSFREGSIVYDRNNQELFRFYDSGENREVVSGDKIPDIVKGAIVGLEDENFYSNSVGIPWANLAGASGKCVISAGKDCRGGSGISQQLIKNVTGDKESTLRRKIDELLIAIKFNQQVAGNTEIEKQDEVLRLYLNWVPFGRNTYGIESGARSWFGKNVNSPELTIPEICYLASMPQRPSTFTGAIEIETLNRQSKENQLSNPNWDILEGRKNACIDKLASKNLKEHGSSKFITEQEAEKLKKEIVTFKPRIGQNLAYGHIRNYLSGELGRLGITETQLVTQGYKIYTTFDKTVQDKVQEIVSNSADSIIIPNGGNNAAGIVIDGPTGGVVAMIGSRDFNNEAIAGQVNVVTSPRQPGSTYKAYDYASAFEKDFNPGTVLLDLTTNFGGYTPANFSRTTQGLSTIRSALQNSLNIPAVKSVYLSQDKGTLPNTNSGLKTVFNFAKKIGVDHPFEDKCTLATAIGGCEVTMISHATGYNTLLQNGDLKTANPFIKILTQDAQEVPGLDKLYPKQNAVVEPAIARQITDVLSDYNSRSPGVWGNGRFTMQLDGWSGANSVAAKSGTTNDVKDTWTVGGSPLYTIAVWVGNTDGKPMKSSATSSATASTIWKNIMTYVHTDKAKVGFSKEGLQKVNLDSLTGLLGEGSSEYLTLNQINTLKKADTRFNDANYNPLENSILSNRSVFARRTLKVTKFDGSVIPAGTVIDEKLVETVVCQQLISEFPKAANWADAANNYAKTLGEKVKTCPTKIYDGKTEGSGPVITNNLQEGKGVPETIKISGKSLIPGSKIKQIQVVIDTKIVADKEDVDSITIDTASLKIKKIQDVKITITDDLGLKTETIIKDVNFDNIISSSSSSSSSKSSATSSSSSKSSNSSSSSTASSL